MFEIRIEQNKAWVLRRETLTAYSEGCEAVRLRLDFDAAWEGLAKIAVFRACDAQIDLALSGDTAQIPPQVLLRPNVHLLLGLYGIRADGAVVIPTVWADLGLIQAAANPCAAENYGKPALELFAQLEALARAAQNAAAAAASGVYAGSVGFALNDSGHLLLRITEDGSTTESDLGPVSAYAAAVAGGYTGTYAQFQALLTANAAVLADVEAALAAARAVSDTAEEARTLARSALGAADAAGIAAAEASSAAAGAQSAVSGKQDRYKARQVVLASGANTWTDLSAEGVTAGNLVIWSAAPQSFDAAAEAGVRMTAQGAGKVSFAATNTTTEEITVSLAVFD